MELLLLLCRGGQHSKSGDGGAKGFSLYLQDHGSRGWWQMGVGWPGQGLGAGLVGHEWTPGDLGGVCGIPPGER